MRERGCDILQVAVIAKGDAVQRRSLKMHDKSRVCCLGWKAGVWTASAAWRGVLCMARQCAHEGLGIEHPLAQGHVYTLTPMLDRDNLEAAMIHGEVAQFEAEVWISSLVELERSAGRQRAGLYAKVPLPCGLVSHELHRALDFSWLVRRLVPTQKWQGELSLLEVHSRLYGALALTVDPGGDCGCQWPGDEVRHIEAERVHLRRVQARCVDADVTFPGGLCAERFLPCHCERDSRESRGAFERHAGLVEVQREMTVLDIVTEEGLRY
jgi:hypothetical protein